MPIIFFTVWAVAIRKIQRAAQMDRAAKRAEFYNWQLQPYRYGYNWWENDFCPLNRGYWYGA